MWSVGRPGGVAIACSRSVAETMRSRLVLTLDGGERGKDGGMEEGRVGRKVERE